MGLNKDTILRKKSQVGILWIYAHTLAGGGPSAGEQGDSI